MTPARSCQQLPLKVVGVIVRCPTVRKMMTSSETSEVENPGGEKSAEDSAILEVSSMAVGGIMKQESRDVDYLSNCSTSIEGSVVRA